MIKAIQEISCLYLLLMFLASELCLANSAAPLLVSKERTTTKIQTSEEYFNFIKKFGWDRTLFDDAFPQGSFNNCINNNSVDTYNLKYKGRKGLVDGWLVQPKQNGNATKSPLVIYNRGGAAKWGFSWLICSIFVS